jgi:hypothetical protein
MTDPANEMRPRSTEPSDPRLEAFALGLTLSRRALESDSLDRLYYLLTNDLRTLVEFDRCHLVVHFGGVNRFVATNNQPTLESKSLIQQKLSHMAASLQTIKKAQLLSADIRKAEITEEDLPSPARAELTDYIETSGCAHLLCVPIPHAGDSVGHLLLEFMEGNVPKELEIRSLLSVTPFLGSALAEKWLLDKKPDIALLTSPSRTAQGQFGSRSARIASACLAAVLVSVVFFLVPFDFTVGGEAVTAPKEKHLAFSKVDGLVQRVFVSEGEEVRNDQPLAVMDPREIEHKIDTEKRQLEILTREATLLRHGSDEQPSRLAESELTELKRRSKLLEVHYLEWQKQFLTIPAPTAGIVLTKDVQSLAGKKFKAGEVFCEIASPGEMYVDVYAPEDRIEYVKPGQRLVLFLNNKPREGIELKVEQVSPTAEVVQRLGNVYRVRAPFRNAPASTRLGLKGFGKIYCFETSLAHLISQRLLTRWNQTRLHF